MIYEITYGQETIRYEVLRAPARRTLGIEVHPDSRVIVRAPNDCSEEIIASRIRKRAAWISRQLAEFQRYTPRTPPRQYMSGETHLYLGRQYRLQVVAGETASVKATRGQLLVTALGTPTPEQVKALLHNWYLRRAKESFSEVLKNCLEHFKERDQPRLIVRAMQSRWGSLSSIGTLTLNARLIKAPRACIEYVIIHELCHRTHRDHDAAFFRLLSGVLPDWEQRKQRLEAALL